MNKQAASAGAMPNRAVLERAAHWLSLMSSGATVAADIEACRRWRDAAPEHEQAWKHLQSLWGELAEPAGGLTGGQARTLVNRAVAAGVKAAGPLSRRRSPVFKAIWAALVLMPLLWAAWRVAPPAWLLADYATRVGQQRVVVLDDDSRIVLNTDSAIDVHYSDTERRVTLRQGEILVVVAKDGASRPFVVATRDGTASAKGTRYTVRLMQDGTRVNVTESEVAVCPRDELAAQCRDVRAGGSAYLTRVAAVPGPAIDPAAAEAWSRQRLNVRDMPLPLVLDELARYRREMLWFDEAALADLRISGVFPLTGDDALASLADSLPIEVKQGIPGVVRIERRVPPK
ncbi:FecR family protein [Achromobacter seleniivolatilans]|uniref:FecR family protein n=1 Tax=Achromobacter seleniivolatilans TaxID=3047478 RepID=A0ABY9M656_9BURK|nr:FecR family protein [Achromobacter sp. R39]WMD22430.1 FecR family protein [Achromobacter sp. R39]